MHDGKASSCDSHRSKKDFICDETAAAAVTALVSYDITSQLSVSVAPHATHRPSNGESSAACESVSIRKSLNGVKGRSPSITLVGVCSELKQFELTLLADSGCRNDQHLTISPNLFTPFDFLTSLFHSVGT